MSKRILVTAPWKLGAFLVLLVLGCTGGLIVAFSQLFEVDLSQGQSQQGLMLVGAGALVLAALAFVVASTLWKSEEEPETESDLRRIVDELGSVKDPRDAQIVGLQSEPPLANLLQGWRSTNMELDAALNQLARHKKDINGIVSRIRESAPIVDSVQVRESEGAYAELAMAANALIQEVREAKDDSGAPVRDAWLDGVGGFRRHHQELEEFADALRRQCAELRRVAGSGPEQTSTHAATQPLVHQMLERSRARLGGLREQAEGLAEDTNALAINFALQVSRLGEPGAEIMTLTEGFRSLSTQFQRVVADLQLTEYDQQVLDTHLAALSPGSGDDTAGSAHAERMATLADGLDRRLADLRGELERFSEHIEHVNRQVTIPPEDLALAPVEEAAPAVAPMVDEEDATFEDENVPYEDENVPYDVSRPGGGDFSEGAETADPIYDLDDFDAQPVSSYEGGSEGASGGDYDEEIGLNGALDAAQQAVEDAAGAIHELNELGAVELSEEAHDEPIYDLNEFGAVPLGS